MRKILLLLVLLAALVTPTQAKVDFTGLEGVYRGNYELKEGSPTLTGRLTARVSVNKGGRMLVIQIYGALKPFAFHRDGALSASYTKLQLTTDHKVSSNTVYIGLDRLQRAARTNFTTRNNRLFQFRLTTPDGRDAAHYNLWFRNGEFQLAGAASNGRNRWGGTFDFLGKKN